MKKDTTTFAEFRSTLKALDEELGLSDRIARTAAAGTTWEGDSGELAALDPTEAPPSGRGRRERTEVYFLNDDEIGGEAGVRAIAAELRAIKGVEHVGEPELDSQLRLIWSIAVIYRVTQ